MKSHKQRRAELREAKKLRAVRRQNPSLGLPKDAVRCNPESLVPNNSYGTPDFVERGWYVDMPFECVDCGVAQVWTATQQKWWYEVAKGDTRTIACRCRPCRRKRKPPRPPADPPKA